MVTLFEKHLCKEFLKNGALFLFSFLTLFILFDFAAHQEKFTRGVFFLNALAEMSKRLPALLPLSLLLSTLKTLSQASQSLELLSHIASGRSIQKTVLPFLSMGLLSTLIVFANFEWGTPQAYLFQDSLHPVKGKPLKTISLKDNSPFFYEQFIKEENKFIGGIWVPNSDHIFTFDSITVGKPSLGHFVTEFSRDETGQIRMTQKKEEVSIDIPFQKNITEKLIPPEDLPISALYKLRKKVPSNEREIQMQAASYNKITLPWFSFLAVLTPIPFSIYFGRNPSQFLLYSASLFALIASLISLNAGFILSKRQIVDPAFVTILPLFIAATASLIHFGRCRGSF